LFLLALAAALLVACAAAPGVAPSISRGPLHRTAGAAAAATAGMLLRSASAISVGVDLARTTHPIAS
jgi:hypothetical protein